MRKKPTIRMKSKETAATDLKKMIVSMQDKGLAPNSIKSYTIGSAVKFLKKQ